jgi:hypothetical protein
LSNRTHYLQRVSTVLLRTQTRNQQARRSQFKTGRRRLHARASSYEPYAFLQVVVAYPG